MKVIFLDVDGVLNNDDTFKRGDELELDFIRNLGILVRKTGAKVVLDSSWRLQWHKRLAVGYMGHLRLLEKELDNVGVKILDITPDLGGNRWEEIRAWLVEADRKGLNVESFICIDDETSWFPKEATEFVVKTSKIPWGKMLTRMDDSTGFTKQYLTEAVQKLNGKDLKLKEFHFKSPLDIRITKVGTGYRYFAFKYNNHEYVCQFIRSWSSLNYYNELMVVYKDGVEIDRVYDARQDYVLRDIHGKRVEYNTVHGQIDTGYMIRAFVSYGLSDGLWEREYQKVVDKEMDLKDYLNLDKPHGWTWYYMAEQFGRPEERGKA